MKLAFLSEALEKFALTGATYARALQNAATRGTGRVGAPVLGAIASQPRAKLMPGLSQQARHTAELPTNVPGRNQALFDKLPAITNTETPIARMGQGDPKQQARFNGALRRGGAVYQAPGTQAKITEAFGDAKAPTPTPYTPSPEQAAKVKAKQEHVEMLQKKHRMRPWADHLQDVQYEHQWGVPRPMRPSGLTDVIPQRHVGANDATGVLQPKMGSLGTLPAARHFLR